MSSRSKKVAKFKSESNTFYLKAKVIKMLYCKSFATLLKPPQSGSDLVSYQVCSGKILINQKNDRKHSLTFSKK